VPCREDRKHCRWLRSLRRVRPTLGISCEAPKFTGLRQLHPLVRRRLPPEARQMPSSLTDASARVS
jgi:hypothetical protein